MRAHTHTPNPHCSREPRNSKFSGTDTEITLRKCGNYYESDMQRVPRIREVTCSPANRSWC